MPSLAGAASSSVPAGDPPPAPPWSVMTHELTLASPCPPDGERYDDPMPDPWQRCSGSGVDMAAARGAAADFLAALGIDLDADGMRETPARMARAYAELFEARPLRLTPFDNAEGHDALWIPRALPCRPVCDD